MPKWREPQRLEEKPSHIPPRPLTDEERVLNMLLGPCKCGKPRHISFDVLGFCIWCGEGRATKL